MLRNTTIAGTAASRCLFQFMFSLPYSEHKMPSIEDKNESEEEDMDQDTPDSEKSEDDESDMASVSDDDDDSSGTWKDHAILIQTQFQVCHLKLLWNVVL